MEVILTWVTEYKIMGARKEMNEGRKEAIEYGRRFERHRDELKWLYMELYPGREDYFDQLCEKMLLAYKRRATYLKKIDRKREQDHHWYKDNHIIGMMLYTDAFAENLKGVNEHLDYIEQSNVNYVHLMPLLDTVEGRSDGGYAVADFRKVKSNLGTMQDFTTLTEECHKRDISICLDFVMNHTSEDHEWAQRARAGEREYKDRYFFYDSYDIPAEYEKMVPDVFPTTAPGNFTYLPECNQHVLTTFYPYQWDLNYWNPCVFNEMADNLLFLTNQGVDIMRIDAVPYIWKQLGTNCRNLPQVHTIVRMIRMICEIVCPGTLLLGEVVMEPDKVTPYFGTIEKPECHMLYNVTTMATVWHTVATKDTRLLKKQLDIVSGLPKDYVFLNYLRCHDDVGWGLDYDTLKTWGLEQEQHKQYLNEYFTGRIESSTSVGELYNDDPVTKDARFCGTTASMCGIERGLYEKNKGKVKLGVQLDLMLHAYMFFQSGIPIIYSGDEVGQLNDWSYKENPLKAPDSRYLHRGYFQWEKQNELKNKKSVSYAIYHTLSKMEAIRKVEKAFVCAAEVRTIDTIDDMVLCVERTFGDETIIGIFNFGNRERTAWINEGEDKLLNLIHGEFVEPNNVVLKPYEFMWLKRKIGH